MASVGFTRNGVELKAERRKPSGEKHCDREPSITHRSACALPLPRIQRHWSLCRRGQDTITTKSDARHSWFLNLVFTNRDGKAVFVGVVFRFHEVHVNSKPCFCTACILSLSFRRRVQAVLDTELLRFIMRVGIDESSNFQFAQ